MNKMETGVCVKQRFSAGINMVYADYTVSCGELLDAFQGVI